MTRQRRPRDRGQSLVEFALLIPIFLILVFGIIDFGLGLRAYISLTQSTREGARFASIGNPAGTFSTGGSGECNGTTTSTVVGRVCRTMNGLDLTDVQSVTVTYPNGNSPGESVRVSASYEYEYITPVRRLVTFFSGGSLPSFLTLSSSTEMRLE
jgi:Flp pilus assembly protein TadG